MVPNHVHGLWTLFVTTAALVQKLEEIRVNDWSQTSPLPHQKPTFLETPNIQQDLHYLQKTGF